MTVKRVKKSRTEETQNGTGEENAKDEFLFEVYVYVWFVQKNNADENKKQSTLKFIKQIFISHFIYNKKIF